MEQKDLLQLIRAGQKGDRQAVEQLVLAVQDRVLFHCVRMMKNRADAEDAAQDILIAMVRGLGALRSPEAFWAWLYRITVNICNHKLGDEKLALLHQQEAEEELLDSLEELDAAYQPEYLLESEEKRRIVVSLIDELPEPQRMCVLLYYYDGLSVRDIASILDSPEGTIKSRLNYARRAIKRGVAAYTRRGIELYGVSPLSLLPYLLQQEAATVAAGNLGYGALAAVGGAAAAGGTVKAVAAALTAKRAVAAALLLLAGVGAAVGVSGALRHTPPPPDPVSQTVRPAEPDKGERVVLPISPARPEDAPVPQARPVETAVRQDPAPPPAVKDDPQPVPSAPAQLLPPEPVLPPEPPAEPPEEPMPTPEPPEEGPLEPEPPAARTEPEKPPAVLPEFAPWWPDTWIWLEEPEPAPDPGPEPEPAPDPVIFNKDVVDFSYNSGYGYTSKFADEWHDFLPPTLSVYTSSDPSVVQINDRGEFTTLLPGTAVLTASDPNVPEVAYTLTISVQDCFNWSFQLPDVQLDVGESRIITVDSWAFDCFPDHAITVEQVEWSSSDPAVAGVEDIPGSLTGRLYPVSPGTAAVTGRVTFRLDTVSGSRSMEDTVSCQVTVPESAPPAPDHGGETVRPIEAAQKTLTDYGYNSGYGYSDSFCSAWGETLPEGLSYESSDPAVVVINEMGRFTTLSAGEAVLTASGPDQRYELTVKVQDCLQWSYTLSDGRVYLDTGKQFDISGCSWLSGIRPLSGKWTSSDPSIAELSDLGGDFWDRCRVVGVSGGTAAITGVITFAVDTAGGTVVTVEETVSFQVDVGTW